MACAFWYTRYMKSTIDVPFILYGISFVVIGMLIGAYFGMRYADIRCAQQEPLYACVDERLDPASFR